MCRIAIALLFHLAGQGGRGGAEGCRDLWYSGLHNERKQYKGRVHEHTGKYVFKAFIKNCSVIAPTAWYPLQSLYLLQVLDEST